MPQQLKQDIRDVGAIDTNRIFHIRTDPRIKKSRIRGRIANEGYQQK